MTTPEQRRRLAAGLMAAQYDKATPQDTTVVERAGLLPIGTYANGMTGLAFPGFIADPVRGFISEATNPVPYLNRSEDEKRQAVETGFDVAGAAMVGGLAAPKPSGIVGSAGGRLSDRGAAAGAAVNALDNPPAGIRAYHGSPHDFDRFDMSKIGTGEGAQAYGHGLYFAENDEVAKSYRNSVSKHSGDSTSTQLFNDNGGNRQKALAEAQRNLKIAKGDGFLGLLGKLSGYETGRPDSIALWQSTVDRLSDQKWTPGRLYEVNIKANPEDFLDWDKPLSQQSEKVRAAAISAWGIEPSQMHDELFARKVPPGISEKLRENGVAGIRYLDQGSRTAGEGSRNYVVFDDKLVEILRKYGLLGMAGGAAVNEMLSGAQEAPRRSWSNAMLPGDA